jgi:ABC-type transporter Mla MlaB component
MSKTESHIDLDFSNNILSLKGHLTMASVPLLEKQVSALRKQFKDPLTIDLSETDHNDTAGLAWLINTKAELLRDKITIKVENVPESLKKLSRLSDADKILAIN